MFLRSSVIVSLTRRVHTTSRWTRQLVVHPALPSTTRTERFFASSSYHIEVSNMARPGVTQIIITGPGVLGLLASMCCTLASVGGSIKTLHAVDSLKEEGVSFGEEKPIRDVITVVDYETGQAFPDDRLHDLAEAVLKSTQSPLEVVSIVRNELEKKRNEKNLDNDNPRGNVTVISEKNFPRL